MTDHRGKEWSTDDFVDQKLLVIVTTGTECPLVQKYLPRLQRLADEFGDQKVAFIGVNANRQDSLAEIAAQVGRLDITFPIVKDNQQSLIAALNASRTPEVFVLDERRVIRYRGRIDDQHAVGNRSKSNPTRHDLKIAIEELLAGDDVSVPRTECVGCLLTRQSPPKENPAVTYSNQIARLLQQHCVECHRPGEIAPFSLMEYQEVAGWADMLVEVTQSGQMPPWHASAEYGHFQNERRLSDNEKQLLVDWAAAGAPEGNPNDLPDPPAYTSGWQLPREPDLVVAMRDKPFAVPAEGTIKYQYFMADPQLTDDKWVSAAEIIPGNRAVVHHVIVFIAREGQKLDLERSTLTAFVPGLRVSPLPAGYAKRLPKGSKLVFQMHYTSNGTAHEDLTKIGLIFARDEDVTHEVRTESVKNLRIALEPGRDDQRFDATPVTAPLEMELLSLSPHMHLRGKSFRYELSWPDGRREVLLDVPRYDFNWQTAYRFREPLAIPKGATLYGYASYDNSAGNLANPDPTKQVTWGEQSWDEMLLGYFDIAVPKTSAAESSLKQIEGIVKPQEIAGRLIKQLDQNGNGQIEKSEVRAAHLAVFQRIDGDQDGVVTAEELAKGVVHLRELVKQR